jgi:hypothetical protein
MSTLEMKSELIRLIDTFDDEDLPDLYGTLLDFAEYRGYPKLGDTSPERIAELQRALERAESGQGITTDELLQKMKQWRTE